MRRGRTPAVSAGLTMALALAACGGGDEAARKDEEPVVVATRSDDDAPEWLSHTDATDPARWLASREAGQAVPETDPRTQRLRRGLTQAKGAFIEDPRMIANRTVQLSQMLAEAGKPEGYADLVDGLAGIAAASHRRQLYGEMCQHYFNTRQQGADKTQALARLAERYGAQDRGRAGP